MKKIIPTIDKHGMHGVITVSSKRQITIPWFARDALRIKPGDRLVLDGSLSVQRGDRLRLTVTPNSMVLRPLHKAVRRT